MMTVSEKKREMDKIRMTYDYGDIADEWIYNVKDCLYWDELLDYIEKIDKD